MSTSLIVGAGLSGIGAAWHLRRDCPRQDVRDPGGARGDRRHLGPVPLPGHPLRLRHVHPRLLVPAVDRPEGHRRRRRRSASTSGRPPASTASTSTSGSATGCCAPSGRAPTARWTVTRQRDDTGDEVALTCAFLFSLHRLLPLRRGLHARLPRRRAVRRAGRPPAALARGPRLRRQAGGGDRQRRDRGHPGAGAGRRAAHVTMLQRSPTYVVALPARDRLADALRALAARRRPRTRWCAGRTCCSARVNYQLSRRAPGAGAGRCCAGPPAAGCRPATTSTSTSRPATTRGTSGSAWCPTATCSGRPRPAAPTVVTDTIDTFTAHGHPARLRRELPADIVVTATGLNCSPSAA